MKKFGRYWIVYGDDVEPLRLLVIYAPPGSERGLRDLPGCQVLPPGEVPNYLKEIRRYGSG